MTCSANSGDRFPLGISTISCSGSGCSPCSFTVEILDQPNPVIFCPGPITGTCADLANLAQFAPQASCSVGCGPVPLPVTVTAGACDAAGNVPLLFSCTDNSNGEWASCPSTLILSDGPCGVPPPPPPPPPPHLPPSNGLTCPPNGHFECAGAGALTPAYWVAPAGATCSANSGDRFPLGISTITCSAAACSPCSFTVEILDQPNPVIFCPGPLQGSCKDLSNLAALAPQASCSVGCGASPLPVTVTAGACNGGVVPLTFTCTDPSNGEVAYCDSQLQISDGPCTAPGPQAARPTLMALGAAKPVAAQEAGAGTAASPQAALLGVLLVAALQLAL